MRKGGVDDLRLYEIETISASGTHGQILLALWPREDMSFFPAGSRDTGDSKYVVTPTTESKSWYLCGKDDKETTKWFHRLKEAVDLPLGGVGPT